MINHGAGAMGDMKLLSCVVCSMVNLGVRFLITYSFQITPIYGNYEDRCNDPITSSTLSDNSVKVVIAYMFYSF